MSRICLTASISSWSNMIISSKRLRNSGANCFFNAFSMIPLAKALVSVIGANPTPLPKSFNCFVPAFDVMIIMVFLKSTRRPFPSVSLPSSITCNSILKTVEFAFSISSSNTMLYGFLRTRSVSCPPSSYPTYPGGAPTRREVLNDSEYSDISIRIRAS